MIRRRFVLLVAGAAMSVTAPLAFAQQWLAGPVRVIVPFDPGSTPDLVARVVSSQLTQSVGHPVIVENKSGAAGYIGTNAVAKATPDGQTTGVSIAGPLAVNPLLFKKLPPDPAPDLHGALNELDPLQLQARRVEQGAFLGDESRFI